MAELDRMTYDEVEAYLASGEGIVVLPVGATEEHGPHGALGTDTFAAAIVARKVAERLGYRLVDLQVLRHGELSEKAESNTRREFVFEPRRGDIRPVLVEQRHGIEDLHRLLEPEPGHLLRWGVDLEDRLEPLHYSVVPHWFQYVICSTGGRAAGLKAVPIV